jgi:hypothetical protein
MLSSTSLAPSTLKMSDPMRPQSSPLQHHSPVPASPDDVSDAFAEVWQEATSDNTFTLHGFRRFRTSHLLNLRFLERELIEIDRKFFQAGLKLKQPDRPLNKLGLNHAKLDPVGMSFRSAINRQDIDRLQDLLNKYGIPLPLW